MADAKNKPILYGIIGLGLGIALGVGAMLTIQAVTKGANAVNLAGVSGPAEGNINLYPSLATDVGENWLIKIDEKYAISLPEFEETFKMVVKQLQEQQKQTISEKDMVAVKQNALETMINIYVVTVNALKVGMIQSNETRLLLNFAFRQSLMQYYLQTLIKDPNSLTPTKEEIEQFYEQNKANLQTMGLSAVQMKQLIQAQLSQRKTQMWMQSAISRIRERYKIERNEALLKKIGIEGELGQGTGTTLMGTPNTPTMPQ